MKLTRFYPVNINDEKFQKHWRLLALAYYLKYKGAYLLDGEERKKYEKAYSKIFVPTGKVIDVDLEKSIFEERDATEADNNGKMFDDFYIIKIDDKDKEALAATTIAEFGETTALSKEDWKIVTEKELKVEEKADLN
jgi:hypothetical protein